MYVDNLEYAAGRLNNTLVRVNKQPFIVHQVVANKGKFVANGWVVGPEGRVTETNVKLTDLDISSPPLGYVNKNGYAVFVARKPTRKWRQGVCFDNIACVNTRKALEGLTDLYQPVMNDYPTIDKANEYVAIGAECAFHRHWALTATKLLYKGHFVGKNDKGRLSLNESYQYLQEVLQEVIDADGR